ncbi:hypothetical protein RA307_29295 [Xanthobacteraceae bacterium Astr-EGSB]|uniref:hypothetical protein n=1 Tax=Astrobacterium formosum TaxID=3069710 RepID=UPI0027AF22B8|nr:hypothetical protein [Xanthobacteraceae bacterium Astr-EGSB]
MDPLHTVLRSLRGDTKSRQHLAVFREFFGHLDRLGGKAARSAAAPPRVKAPRAKVPRAKGPRLRATR